MSATATDLRTWLEVRRRAFDAVLEASLPPSSRVPHVVAESMRYSVLAGGKRMRPMLALAAAEAVAERLGRDPESALPLAMPAACALELIHTYSLVHDDLPAMDNDTMRRGQPTAHVVFGEGQAILAGDALLTEAFAVLARDMAAAADLDAADVLQRRLRTIAIIADAAGPAGMVGGQALDLQAAEPGAVPLDDVALREMHARKTGALIVASVVAGAIMAGADDALTAAARRYGAEIGLAFQIVDDVLDVEGASKDLGKTAGKDAAAGKTTYPSLYGLAESKRLAAECVERALSALDHAGLGGQLPAIARWILGRSN